ncbi:MAG: phospholipid carrier-dependent glycosyltransferase [Vulcanimicrobiaceae bacterium]
MKRSWFSPGEGVAGLTRLDILIAAVLTVASFILTAVHYTWPAHWYFDEVYYPRSAQEYLKGAPQYEWTHPPLTKELIAFSMLLWGGLHSAHGDTAYGWRFMNLVVGALMVFLIYAFAKRITGSTAFATIAGGLLLFDGFHFAQARIATPEITVGFLTLATSYAFYRYWIASQVRVAPELRKGWFTVYAIGTMACAGAGFLLSWLVAGRLFHQWPVAVAVAGLYLTLVLYLIFRLNVLPRLCATGIREASYADGSVVRVEANGESAFARIPDSVKMRKGTRYYNDGELQIAYERDCTLGYSTPDGFATFSPDGTMYAKGATLRRGDAALWLWVLGLACGLAAAAKWNGLFNIFAIWAIGGLIVLARRSYRPAVWGNPFGIPLDVLVAVMLVATASVYTLSYTPFFMTPKPATYAVGHDLDALLELQNQMFVYHDVTVARDQPHPYASKWWEWPLLYQPVVYAYEPSGAVADGAAKGCCVQEIIALPNPLVWWAGLITVPLVAVLAWRERNKAYLLLVVSYLVQWLPWTRSPRMLFEYHFFPNLAIICLCDAIALKWVWDRFKDDPGTAMAAKISIGVALGAVVLLFVFFYPTLSFAPTTYEAWRMRMWFPHWIIGPG